MSREVAPNAMRTPISLVRCVTGVREHSVQSDRRQQQRQQSERAHERVLCVGVVNWRANMSSRVWTRHMGWFLSMDHIA